MGARLLTLFLAALFCAACDATVGAPDEPAEGRTTPEAAFAAAAQSSPDRGATAGVAGSPTTTGPQPLVGDLTPRLLPPATGSPPKSAGLPPPPVSALSAVVMDEASGAVLWERQPRLRLPPASLTKIATAVLAIERGGIEREVEVQPDPERYWLEDSSAMGLEPGDRISIRDLLFGLMLVSGNDAAEALAQATEGSIEAFVPRMNALAGRLGLHDTRFVDVHGLGGDGHYSSAHDMALLSRYAMSLPAFREVAGTETHTVKLNREIFLYNFNPLLNYTTGVDGVKTGYTEEAGHTFAVSASRGGHRVYVVLMNAPLLIHDAITLIEWTFANFTWES